MEQADKVWRLAYRDFRALSFIYIILFLILLVAAVNTGPAMLIPVVIFGAITLLLIWLAILFKKHDTKSIKIGFPLIIISFILMVSQYIFGGFSNQDLLGVFVQAYLLYRVNTVRKIS